MSVEERIDLRGRLDRPPVVPFRYQPPLDGVRGLSMMIVLFVHYAGGMSTWAQTRIFGMVLVIDSFFILSGFLITSLLLEEWSNNGRISMRNFYVRRGLRLLPALAAILVFVAVVTLVTDWLPLKRTFAEIALAALYLYPVALIKWESGAFLAHLWTLSVEEWFYFGWPTLLAIFGLRSRSRRRLRLVIWGLVGFVVFCFVVRRVGSQDGASKLIYLLRPDSLFYGALLAFFVRKLPDLRTPRLDRILRFLGPVGIALAIWCFVAKFPNDPTWDEATFQAHSMRSWTFQLGIWAMLLCVAHAAIHPDSLWAKCLSWRPLVWLGTLSYALYLWHQVLFRLYVEHINDNAVTTGPVWAKWATGVGCLIATIVVAVISQKVIERPALKQKKRFEVVHYADKR